MPASSLRGQCLSVAVFAAGLCAWCGSALAQGVPDYGFEWRTIGAVGNAPASPDDYIFLGPEWDNWGPIGDVAYEYRMARTEVTVSQYLEFVQAYAAANPAVPNSIGFTGTNIYRNSQGQYVAFGDALHVASDMGWLYAARYCNWLHNGKAMNIEAFENGAYDTSTFVQSPDGTWSGQSVHHPDAMFWIPTLDEWTKGMHYDPHKNGENQPGYWLYPTMSDEPPIGGLPGTPGAQTGAGEYPGGETFRLFPVGSYPDTQSPWGLLDGSGGEREYVATGITLDVGFTRGTANTAVPPFLRDRLDILGGLGPLFPSGGLRLAGVVPAPSSLCFVLTGVLIVGSRRRA